MRERLPADAWDARVEVLRKSVELGPHDSRLPLTLAPRSDVGVEVARHGPAQSLRSSHHRARRGTRTVIPVRRPHRVRR